VLKTLSYIAKHPLTRARPLAGFARFARWQIESRLKREVEFQWIDGAKLIVRNGMTGATGNIYCGLHEFADMSFVVHMLRRGDLFVDVGANIGSYTVLASAVALADTIAIEPDPDTMGHLLRNVDINGLRSRVTLVEAAVGSVAGTSRFTIGLDTINHLSSTDAPNTREVSVITLDDILREQSPVLIKLDVEGFEAEVFAGARETLAKPTLLAVETESNSDAVASQLADAGFDEVFYDPFKREIRDQQVWPQNNALYVRDRKACGERLALAPTMRVFGVAL